MKRTPIKVAAGIFLLLMFNQAYSQNMELKNSAHKVVFQLSTNDTLEQKAFIKQLSNLLNAMEAITVEVVVHGPGVELFIAEQSRYKNNLEALHRQGIQYLICQNTLNEKRIAPEKLLQFTRIIPAGIVHIIQRQEEGWSYIKAGF